jgi:HAD superfamily hydrolase (TIGR01490 family)
MKRNFAVFDIDGTLIRWQLYHAVVQKLASAGHLGPDALKTLHEARMRWKNREHKEAFHDYERTLIQTYEDALPNLKPQDFDTYVEQVITEYKDQVYTYTRDLIQSLKNQGYFLLAISGSHQELVRAIAMHYGFDDYVGTQYDRTTNAFSGKKQLGSADKKSILQRLIAKHSLSTKDSVAVGDSLSDAAMMELVEQPIAFNPDQKLYDRARSESWKIVVERKNVIYEMEPHGTTYLLA